MIKERIFPKFSEEKIFTEWERIKYLKLCTVVEVCDVRMHTEKSVTSE